VFSHLIPLLLNIFLEQIEQQFPFFPRLHAIMASRPNVTPITVTTGVGSNGHKTIYYQDPNEGVSGVFSEPVDTTRQYQTFLAALEGEHAHRQQVVLEVPDKENQAPSPPAITPSVAKMAATNLLLKAKASIRKVAPKPTLEETLMEMQQ
jgi:hypothetical protein